MKNRRQLFGGLAALAATAALGISGARGFLESLITARPAFQPTDDQRLNALILAAARWPHQDIAEHLEVSPEVLQKHFEYELGAGAAQYRAEFIRATWESARA